MLARRPFTATFVVPILLTLMLVSRGTAQTTATAAWRATPASVLKGVLRDVAAAQSRHFTTHRAYAGSVAPLGIALEPRVRVDLLAVGPAGWQARATHRDQPGRSCVIFVGRVEGVESPRTDGDREMAGENGVPLCDLMR